MTKDKIELNKYNYLMDRYIENCDSFEILGFIINPRKIDRHIYTEVISITKHKLEDEEDYYSYYSFDTILKCKENTKEEVLKNIKEKYLNDTSLSSSGVSASGTKEVILGELLSHYELDRENLIKMLMM